MFCFIFISIVITVNHYVIVCYKNNKTQNIFVYSIINDLFRLKKNFHIKKLNNVDILRELLIHDELKIVQIEKAFKTMQDVIALK